MNNVKEKQFLVVKTKQMLLPEDRLKVRRQLEREMEGGVVVLPGYLEFCCVVSAEEVHIMHDDLFPCDPDKNDRCNKNNCYRNGGDCYLTQFEDYRK